MKIFTYFFVFLATLLAIFVYLFFVTRIGFTFPNMIYYLVISIIVNAIFIAILLIIKLREDRSREKYTIGDFYEDLP